MSVASEYVEKVKDIPKRPEFVDDDGQVGAYVTKDGDLDALEWLYTPEEALKLAQWIIDTFGEKK